MKSVEQRVKEFRLSLTSPYLGEDVPWPGEKEPFPDNPADQAEDMYRELQAIAIVNGLPIEEILERAKSTVKAFKIDEYCLKQKTKELFLA